MLTVLIQEALHEYYRKKLHIQKYRISRFHPAEIEQRRNKGQQYPYYNPFQFKPSTTFSPEASYEIPDSVKDFLNRTLQSFPSNPVAVKILQGIPVGKSETMMLSESMIELPHFPFKQPRKLMNLLILLATENQKR